MSTTPKFDLKTSEGGRGFIANLFVTVLRRHDFTTYIKERLAADFACALSQLISSAQAREFELQQRLTAADERADVLEGRVSMLIRELKELINDDDGILVAAELSTGFVWHVLQKHGKAIQAALKPAEAKRNQCDGCQAGIPVVNGAHRMGKPGGYPDTMSCTAKLYRPASGSTCNQILEESGLPTNYLCKSCGRGACIDR
jgi:hypothetical protein